MGKSEPSSTILQLLKIAGWIFGGIYICVGFIELFSKHFIVGIFSLLLGLSLISYFWAFLYHETKILLKWWQKFIVIILLFIVISLVAPENENISLENQDKSKDEFVMDTPSDGEKIETPTTNQELVQLDNDGPSPTKYYVELTADGFPNDSISVSVANLDRAADKYINQKVNFSCIASSIVKDSTGRATHLNCYDSNNISNMLLINISGFDITKINDGDKIKFYGLVEGVTNGTNAFGGNVTKTTILALFIHNLTTGYKN